jgi:hypothetical protein
MTDITRFEPQTHLSEIDSDMLNELSFGGNTLEQNLQKVKEVFVDFKRYEKMFCKSQTAFMDAQLTISGPNLHHYLKEILAKINSKKDAVMENHWRIARTLIEIEKLKEQIELMDEGFDKQLKQVDLNEKMSGLATSKKYYEAALKKLLILDNIRKQIEEKVQIDEKSYEDSEARAFVSHGILLCLRDMRATGRIGKGAQELMDRLGINIHKVLKDCSDYLKKERESEDYSNDIQFKFLKECEEKMASCVSHKLRTWNSVDVEQFGDLFYQEFDKKE